MKRLYYMLVVGLIIIVSSCTVSRNYAQPAYYDNYDNVYQDPYQSGITYQQFYDDLSPYGSWISYPGYGYVWSPRIAGFRPYMTNGYWVYSSYGWTWVSNYSWGWAPFHYGRWTFDVALGWLWVPGYEWAPAWVAWSGGGGYYGWAPLGPGMSINISFGLIPHNYWSYVPNRYIYSRNVSNYYVQNNTTIINKTTIINNNNYYGTQTNIYNAGPNVREVEKATNSRIAPVRVLSNSKPGETSVRNNTVSIYRPQVSRTASNSKPSNVVSRQEVNGTNGNNSRSLNESTIRGNQPQTQPSNNSSNRISRTPSNEGSLQPGSGRTIQQRPNTTTPPVQRNISPEPSRSNSAPVREMRPSGTPPGNAPVNDNRMMRQPAPRPTAPTIRTETSDPRSGGSTRIERSASPRSISSSAIDGNSPSQRGNFWRQRPLAEEREMKTSSARTSSPRSFERTERTVSRSSSRPERTTSEGRSSRVSGRR